MPDAVVRRLEESLAAEHLLVAGGPHGEAPLRALWSAQTARRSETPRSAILGLAAGVTVIAGLGVFGLKVLQGNEDNPGTQAQIIAPSARMLPSIRTGGGSALPTNLPSHWGAPVSALRAVSTASSTAYAAATLPTQAGRLWNSIPTPLPGYSAEQPGIGPLASGPGLADCLKALDVPTQGRVIVDFATFEGKAGAVVVTETADGPVARVVERSCRTGNPGLLHGPVSLR